MAVFVAQAMVFFDGADQNDAWAQGQAQWIVDNTKVLTGQTLLVAGDGGERSSYCVMSRVEQDGTLTPLSSWHVNDSGAVTDGLPGDTPAPVAGAWADATPYVRDDVVTWNGATYRCLQPHTSNLAAGWTPAVGSLWAVV